VATYLLDTNALVDWLGGVRSVTNILEELSIGDNVFSVCCVSIAEFYSGLADHERPRADIFTAPFTYWDIDPVAARQAGHYRYSYKRRGIQLSAPDTLIAALAVSRDATLITANVRDFPMPEIKLLPLPPR
jgi:predicted nucleic acid-binding protein